MLLPFALFGRRRPVVSVVNLRGLISGGRFGSLSLQTCERALEAVRAALRARCVGAATHTCLARAATLRRACCAACPCRPPSQAFRGLWRPPAAVALAVNSPGGSPVQAAQLYRRIRELSAKHNVQVLTFAEDVAASGGFYLLCAGDAVYASEARARRARVLARAHRTPRRHAKTSFGPHGGVCVLTPRSRTAQASIVGSVGVGARDAPAASPCPSFCSIS